MNIFKYKADKSKSSSNEFKEYIDGQLNYLEFSSSTQKGLLFFLGTSIVSEINNTPFELGFDRKDQKKFPEFIV